MKVIQLFHAYKKSALIYLSSWAKIDLWQSPKSSPQILMFRSADPDTNSVLSWEMSMQVTGSLCPYSDRKNYIKENVQVFLIKRIHFQQEKHQGTCTWYQEWKLFFRGPLASCHAAQSLQVMTKRPCKSGKTIHTCTCSLHLTEILQKKTLKLCTF